MREPMPAAVRFNPSGWLASWSDAGGIVFRAGDHLYLGRSPAIDSEGRGRLDALRTEIWRPGAAAALANYLYRRSLGEVQG